MLIVKILTLTFIFPELLSQKLDAFGRPKCCSDSLSPIQRGPQPWMDTLRQTTYQSIIRHLDYSGSLDGRLSRDHALWRLLNEAVFIPNHNSDHHIITGMLIDTTPNNQSPSFEFRQTDNLKLCSRGDCHIKDKSLLALWQVQRSNNPYTLYIRIKLPQISALPIEDVYEYTPKYGIKKINPDPLQHNSFDNQKDHRFSLPRKNKDELQSVERVDIRFPGSSKGFTASSNKGFGAGSSKGFGVGRLIPTSFLYDSTTAPRQNENGWISSSVVRNPQLGIINVGIRNPSQVMSFNGMAGQYITPGSQGFQHNIHNLPSASPPPQHLDHPMHELKGFLPLVQPISAPPSYKAQYVYDPRYVLYYNQPNLVKPTPPPTNGFKPSTEFVRYSEVDPIYHPDRETDLLQTSPMPENNLPKTLHFPSSINEQLPPSTPSSMQVTNTPFQIIVGEFNPSIQTTTKKITPVLLNTIPPTTTRIPQTTLTTKSLNKTQSFKFEEEDKSLIKVFGEKIKPKNLLKTTTPFNDPVPKFPKKNITDFDNRKKIYQIDSNYESRRKNKSQENNPSISQNFNFNREKQYYSKNEHNKTFIQITTEITDVNPEIITTEKNEKETTYTDLEETTTINTLQEDTVTEGNLMKDVQPFQNFETTRKHTLGPILVLDIKPTETTNTIITETGHTETEQPDTESVTVNNILIDITTEVNSETTINDFYNADQNISSPSLVEDSEITTIINDKATTINSTDKYSTEKSKSYQADVDTQESKQENVQYRLLTFPGDSVSIVANRISKTVSFKTGSGKEKKLKSKEPFMSRHRFSDLYKDYTTIL